MYSMTGYGRGTASLDGRELNIELKSVNNRFLDIGMKLPRQLSFLEDGLRKLLNDNLSRGHVDVFVNYRNLRSDAKTVRVDEALLKAYLTSARESAKALDLDDDLTLSKALTLPDVTTILPADATNTALCWVSSNPDIISVDDNGIITRHAEGVATITAYAADGGSAKGSVVIEELTKVEDLTPDALRTGAGRHIYNLGGQHVSDSNISRYTSRNTAATSLNKGIYIVEGKKIITR